MPCSIEATIIMQIISLTPFFKSYFAAEVYLEISGYHCENNVWIDNNSHFATVVAKGDGVCVEFINNKEKHS